MCYCLVVSFSRQFMILSSQNDIVHKLLLALDKVISKVIMG